MTPYLMDALLERLRGRLAAALSAYSPSVPLVHVAAALGFDTLRQVTAALLLRVLRATENWHDFCTVDNCQHVWCKMQTSSDILDPARAAGMQLGSKATWHLNLCVRGRLVSIWNGEGQKWTGKPAHW